MRAYNIIQQVEPGSIAQEAGIAPGDCLLKINGEEIYDILEYKFYSAATELELEIERPDGELLQVKVEKDEYEDLGIDFRYPLLSKPRGCANHCIFCFIDQLPKGLRKTLYFKDDDSRLSFLQGNYVTLTNLSEREIKSIGKMRVSPINVSVHTTDEELRRMMMGNKNAGKVNEIMRYWADCGISMNCQIVLCKGINDGPRLDKTITDLCALWPHVSSLAVVPAGLSCHRQGLFELQTYEKREAAAVIRQIEKWQERLLKQLGSRFVFASDEFYLQAETPLPDYEAYEDFPQLENGVGLLACMQDEFDYCLEDMEKMSCSRTVSIATGTAAYPFIKALARRLMEKAEGLCIHVYRVENRLFGKTVTVAGLLCGRDILHALRSKPLGDTLYITASMLRDGENVLLDDMTVQELGEALSVRVQAVDNDGQDFIYKLTNTVF